MVNVAGGTVFQLGQTSAPPELPKFDLHDKADGAEPHAGVVNSLAFSPNGKYLATAGVDGNALIYSLSNGEISATLRAGSERQGVFKSALLQVAYSPDGKRVATLAGSDGARIWDTASDRPLTSVIEHHQEIPMAVFSHDAKRIAIASRLERGQARVFDAATGKALFPAVPQSDAGRRLAFSPNDRWLVISGEKGVRLLDANSGAPVALPVKPTAPIQDLVFSPEGSWIATCAGSSAPAAGQKGTWQVQVWQVKTGEPITSLLEIAVIGSGLPGACAPRMVFSEDGHWLAVITGSEGDAAGEEVAGFVSRVQTVETRRGAVLSPPFEVRGHIRQSFFGPNSTHLFMLGSAPGTLTVRDLAPGENLALRQPQDHDYSPREISRDGRWLLGSAQGGGASGRLIRANRLRQCSAEVGGRSSDARAIRWLPMAVSFWLAVRWHHSCGRSRPTSARWRWSRARFNCWRHAKSMCRAA